MDETLKALIDKGYGGWVILLILIPHGIGFVHQLLRFIASPARERRLYKFMEGDVRPMITSIHKLTEEVTFLSGRLKKD